MTAKGSCLCKRVAYEVELPFEIFVYCHCSRCRKATGSAHAANGFVKPERFRWTKGESDIQRYDIPEAKRFALQFCRYCGSRVPHLMRNGARMVIPAGSLDDDPGSRPQAIVHWGSRAAWYRESGDMEKHESSPD